MHGSHSTGQAPLISMQPELAVHRRGELFSQARRVSCQLLGELMKQLSNVTAIVSATNEMPLTVISKQLLFHLGGKSAVQKMTAAMAIIEWANAQQVE